MNDGEAAKIFEDYKFNLEKVKLRTESRKEKENADQKKKDEEKKLDLEKAKKDEEKEIVIEKAKKVDESDTEMKKEMEINMGSEEEAGNSSVVDIRDNVGEEHGNEEKGTQKKILKQTQNLVAVHDKKVKKEEGAVKVEKKEEGAVKVEKKEEGAEGEKKEKVPEKGEKEKQSEECQEVKGPEGDQDAAMLEILKKFKPGKNSNLVKKKRKRESGKILDAKDAEKKMKDDLKRVEAE